MAATSSAASTQNHFREELIGLLNETGESNAFAAETSRICGIDFFAGVTIDGMGVLALPVTPSVAAGVKPLANVAPYGKGLETVVDASVRRALQIDSTKVALSEALREAVNTMLAECMEIMGVHGEVEPVLYKLLFYETGGHFDWHRDTVLSTLLVLHHLSRSSYFLFFICQITDTQLF